MEKYERLWKKLVLSVHGMRDGAKIMGNRVLEMAYNDVINTAFTLEKNYEEEENGKK